MKKINCFIRSMLVYGCFVGGYSYAVEIPQSAVLQYSGSYGIPATMTFKRNAQNYTISANINVPLYKIRFESGGVIVGNELKPTYYRDVRNGKVYASAQFSGNTATYGKTGESKTEMVAGKVMDLFTLSWQLAINDGKLPAQLRITNGKNLYRVGAMTSAGSTKMNISGKQISINQFHVKRGDDTVVYGFAPELHNIPALIHYNDGDKKYRLNLKSVNINGQSLQP